MNLINLCDETINKLKFALLLDHGFILFNPHVNVSTINISTYTKHDRIASTVNIPHPNNPGECPGSIGVDPEGNERNLSERSLHPSESVYHVHWPICIPYNV